MDNDGRRSAKAKLVVGIAALVLSVFCACWLPFVVLRAYGVFLTLVSGVEDVTPPPSPAVREDASSRLYEEDR